MGIKTSFPAAAFLMLLLMAPSTAIADLSGDLEVRVENPGGETMEEKGKIFIEGDPFESTTTRVEMTGPDGTEVIMITRGEENKAFLVMPEIEAYSELALDDTTGSEAPGAGLKREDFKITGQENLDGVATDVGVAQVKDDQGQVVGNARVNFAKELDGAPVRSRIELDNGSVAETVISNPSDEKIDASKFLPPDEYQETRLPLFEDPFTEELTEPTEPTITQ